MQYTCFYKKPVYKKLETGTYFFIRNSFIKKAEERRNNSCEEGFRKVNKGLHIKKE